MPNAKAEKDRPYIALDQASRNLWHVPEQNLLDAEYPKWTLLDHSGTLQYLPDQASMGTL